MKFEHRQVIGRQACAACGRTVHVQIDAKGKCYAICDGRADPDGAGCNTRLQIGARPSEDLKQAYIDARAKKGAKSHEAERLSTDDGGRGDASGDDGAAVVSAGADAGSERRQQQPAGGFLGRFRASR